MLSTADGCQAYCTMLAYSHFILAMETKKAEQLKTFYYRHFIRFIVRPSSAVLGLCCGGATVGSVSSSLLVSSDLCRLLCLHKDKVGVEQYDTRIHSTN
jgi:hypothetical protein